MIKLAPKPLHLQILSAEFERRLAKNPRYSIRAFARFLAIHPSALSRIFSGKQDVSLKACPRLLEKLKLDGPTQRLFLTSVIAARQRKAVREIGDLIAAVEPQAATDGPGYIARLKVQTLPERLPTAHQLIERFLADLGAYLDTGDGGSAYELRVHLEPLPVRDE